MTAPLSAMARASSGTYTSLHINKPSLPNSVSNTGSASASWYLKSQNFPPS